MKILAIDPGSEQSAYMLYDPQPLQPTGYLCPSRMGIIDNHELEAYLQSSNTISPQWDYVIESVSSFMLRASKEVFIACSWGGIFAGTIQTRLRYSNTRVHFIDRRTVKLHLLGRVAGNDADITFALYERFGGSRKKAVGTIKNKGPLYGVKLHLWQALACAITYTDQHEEKGD